MQKVLLLAGTSLTEAVHLSRFMMNFYNSLFSVLQFSFLNIPDSLVRLARLPPERRINQIVKREKDVRSNRTFFIVI